MRNEEDSMRSIQAIGLAAILLTACGQPSDLSSSAPASETPAATSAAGSSDSETVATQPTLLPCPTSTPYATSLPGATPTPTNTPPPTPTIDPEAVLSARAPGGLGSIILPTDDAMIRGIFAALPETIGDYQGIKGEDPSPYYFAIQYDSPRSHPTNPRSTLTLEAERDPGDQSVFPAQFFMPTGALRRDGQIFYTSTELYRGCNPEGPMSLIFTTADTPWKFHVRAGTREEIELLLSTFVQTVNASPAPIPYMTPTPWPTAVPRPGYPEPSFPVPSYPMPGNATLHSTPTATPAAP